MANKNIDKDLEPIISYARELAIGWKHGFINYDHLFVAMLRKKCIAAPYLAHCNTEVWAAKIKALYPANGKKTINDSLPLTIQAERVVRHSYEIAAAGNRKAANTIDVLLAILSFENEITKAFNQAGIAIENIPGFPDKNKAAKFSAIIKVIRNDLYSKAELFFLSSETKQKKLTELYHNANDLYMYGQIGECINICKIGLSISASDFYLRRLLAYCHLKKSDFEPARIILVELVKEKPEITDLRVNLSYVLDETGNYAEAADILDKLLQEQPGNDVYLNNRGFNLFRQEKYAEAAPFFEKAIQLNPSFAYPWNNLGFAKYKLGETEKAFSLIDKSLELDKGNPFAYKHMGIIFMEQGNKEEALKNFHFALKYHYTEKYGDEVLDLLKNLD